MVVLGVVEGRFGRRFDLRRDFPFAFLRQFFPVFLLRRLRLLQLSLGVGVYGRSVLGSSVVSLSHPLRRIVGFPENLQDLLEGYFFWFIDDAYDFRMIGTAGANFVVGRVFRVSSRVSHLCGVDSFGLPE